MSLETLAKQIAVDTKTETKRIALEAQAKAREIVQQAEKQRKQLLSETENSGKRLAIAEKAELLAAAKLEAKRMVEEAKEEKIQAILAIAWKEFARQRETKNYNRILKALIEKGIAGIGENAVTMVNEKDISTAKDFSKKAKIKKAEIIAGAIIATEDEKIIVNNSFEAIFEEKSDAMKAMLFQKIFAEKNNGRGKK